MVAQQNYEYDEYNNYYDANTAKKIKPNSYNKTTKSVKFKKNRVMLIPSILAIFAMTLIITCRYTLINEKNLECIRLKNDLEKAEATLFSTKVSVEQKTDLNKIEAYAKQQLGMQKPTTNQIIYIDTSKSSGMVEIAKSSNIFSNIKDGVSNIIKNIF